MSGVRRNIHEFMAPVILVADVLYNFNILILCSCRFSQT